MRFINPSFSIEDEKYLDPIRIMKLIERAGRNCYKSEKKITKDSYINFIKMLVQNYKHLSVIEHGNITVRFICNRGFTHELVRHRLAAYSQESTRYCNYSKGKSPHITFIIPSIYQDILKPGEYDFDCWFSNEFSETPGLIDWILAMASAEESYFTLINNGLKPQIARGVLPIDLKTEIVMTCNLREWRHIFSLRTSEAAHPSMHQLMRPLLKKFKEMFPPIYEDII